MVYLYNPATVRNSCGALQEEKIITNHPDFIGVFFYPETDAK